MKKNNKIGVLGAGLWGAALAGEMAGRGGRVWLWEFYPAAAEGLQSSRLHPQIPGFRLPPGVHVTSDLGKVVEGAWFLLFVTPSQFLRATARAAAEAWRPGGAPIVVSASKGIDPDTLTTLGDVVASEMKGLKPLVYALSGPSFAREVARGVPTRLVLAGPGGRPARLLEEAIGGGALRIERSLDRRGVELGGALKNVLAIGCGILDGLGCGANARAAFMTRGIEEMAKLIRRCGGESATAYGPAGLGDFILTGTSRESRNCSLGERLGRGESLPNALRAIPTVVEGVETAESAVRLARRKGLRLPLLEAVDAVLRGRGSPRPLLLGAMGF